MADRIGQTSTRLGGRRIELYVPFRWKGRRVTAIDIGPCRLDHVLRWQHGKFNTAIELLADMVGQPEELLRQLCYPDTDRVLAAFADMVPPAMQRDIAAGNIPIAGLAVGSSEPATNPNIAGNGAERFTPEVEPEPEAESDTPTITDQDTGETFEAPPWPYPGGTPPDPGALPEPPRETDFDPMSEG